MIGSPPTTISQSPLVLVSIHLIETEESLSSQRFPLHSFNHLSESLCVSVGFQLHCQCLPITLLHPGHPALVCSAPALYWGITVPSIWAEKHQIVSSPDTHPTSGAGTYKDTVDNSNCKSGGRLSTRGAQTLTALRGYLSLALNSNFGDMSGHGNHMTNYND